MKCTNKVFFLRGLLKHNHNLIAFDYTLTDWLKLHIHFSDYCNIFHFDQNEKHLSCKRYWKTGTQDPSVTLQSL